jgi:hypothetical protein
MATVRGVVVDRLDADASWEVMREPRLVKPL